MAFFEYCTKCGGMFSSEDAWNEHRKTHENKAASGKKAFDEVEKKVLIETASEVPGADAGEIEDLRIAKTKDLRAVKKALKKAGIECQTMNADEARDAYEKAKADGKITE